MSIQAFSQCSFLSSQTRLERAFIDVYKMSARLHVCGSVSRSLGQHISGVFGILLLGVRFYKLLHC